MGTWKLIGSPGRKRKGQREVHAKFRAKAKATNPTARTRSFLWNPLKSWLGVLKYRRLARILLDTCETAARLGNRRLFVRPKHRAHRVANLAQRRVRLHRVVDERHQVLFPLRRPAQRRQPPPPFIRRALRPQLF